MQDQEDGLTPIPTAEEWIKRQGYDYWPQEDGTFLVNGSLELTFSGLSQLPDFSNFVIMGDFSCSRMGLTSLKGSPRIVGGSFYCCDNMLGNLEGGPEQVGNWFHCGNNRITSLKGGPVSAGHYACNGNKLESLEGVAPDFMYLGSDFGTFHALAEIPDHLAGDTKARAVADEAEKIATVAREATELSQPLMIRRPVKFAAKPSF